MSTDDLPEVVRLENQYLKLGMAERARMMTDNQRTLDGVDGQLQCDREYENRLAEATAESRFKDKWKPPANTPPPKSKGDDMAINIDSPITTVNHHYPPPPARQPPPSAPKTKSRMSSILKAGALAAALLGTGGAGAAIPWMLGMFDKPTPPPVEQQDRWVPRVLEPYVPPAERTQ